MRLSPFGIYGITAGLILVLSAAAALFLIGKGDFIILPGQAGNKYIVMKLILTGTAISAINILVSWAVFRKDRVASHIAGGLAIAVSVIILLKVATVLSFW